MATLKNIADKSGVSIATVSRVLNCDKSLSISIDKKELILKIADELEYQTPRNRSNSEKKYKKKVVIYSRYSLEYQLEDPYFLTMRLSIQKYLSQNFDIVTTINDFEEMEKALKKDVDGIIVIGKLQSEQIDYLFKLTPKIVFVDSTSDKRIGDSVFIDYEYAVESVLKYFIDEKGFKKIGFIGGEIKYGGTVTIGSSRRNTYEKFMKSRGLFDEKNVYIGYFKSDSGYELMKQALDDDNLPEAFFISSDSLAIGALTALHEGGIHIPSNLSIIGFNDISNAKFTFPALSTVRVHIDFMAKTAVELLIEQFQGRNIYKFVMVPTELILRDSH